VEGGAQHLGQHEHELAVVDRSDDLINNEAAQDFGPLLLAGGADATELAGEGHQKLAVARAAPSARKSKRRASAPDKALQRIHRPRR